VNKGRLFAGAATGAASVAAALLVPAEMKLPTALIVCCLGLWLTELLPPFAPTLVLLAVAPMVVPGMSVSAAQRTVFAWAADPVLALFFGGFVMGSAAHRHGVDEKIARWVVERSVGDVRRLTLLLMVGTAILTMWMSSVAAPAMMLGAARPLLARLEADGLTRRRLLVAIAMAANVAGMSTPLSAGPNGIAIAAVQSEVRVTFAGWMTFALPLVVGLLALAYLMVRPPPGVIALEANGPPAPISHSAMHFVTIVIATIALWLTEPLHGVPSAVVSLGLAALLFSSRLVHASDLGRIDWSTLLLIAGGILLGRLTEHIGLLSLIANAVDPASLSPLLARLILCGAAAFIAALMSNTATSALLIPIALQIDPSPSTAILVAVATSLGAPFIISTPVNAMVAGEGARSRDLLIPGAVLMVVGVVLLATTGPAVLALWGIR
jgi:solute carrier family 13 (sodium-dependent dicarboxylate transporter), member 2/3/5